MENLFLVSLVIETDSYTLDNYFISYNAEPTNEEYESQGYTIEQDMQGRDEIWYSQEFMCSPTVTPISWAEAETLSRLHIAFSTDKEHSTFLGKVAIYKSIDELSNLIANEDVEAAFKVLKKAKEGGNGGDSADNYVSMWEPLEDRYTVDQLLDLI